LLSKQAPWNTGAKGVIDMQLTKFIALLFFSAGAAYAMPDGPTLKSYLNRDIKKPQEILNFISSNGWLQDVQDGSCPGLDALNRFAVVGARVTEINVGSVTPLNEIMKNSADSVDSSRTQAVLVKLKIVYPDKTVSGLNSVCSLK
jgi:hypothetical protein